MKKMVNPLVMWFMVIIGVIIIFTTVDNKNLFPSLLLNKFILLLSVVYWLYFFTSALRVHKQAVKGAERINKIIDNGVYGMVRHPIYAADIVLIWGIFVVFPSSIILFIAIYFTIILFIWMKLEEKVLIERFEEQYLEYMRKVPMIIPKINLKQ